MIRGPFSPTPTIEKSKVKVAGTISDAEKKKQRMAEMSAAMGRREKPTTGIAAGVELGGAKSAADHMVKAGAFQRSAGWLGVLGGLPAIGLRGEKYANPAAGMDAITWMGVTTWRLGGAGAFVLFTGLSIIPAKLTLGDCITRCIAAIYLRQRSRSFRGWVEKIEDIHLFTWILRGLLLSLSLIHI